ncbi:MAG: hypothetical protein ABFS32_21100, partial [Bacteroidota bacterium]
MQLQAHTPGFGYENLGATSTITNGERVGGTKTVSITETLFESITGYVDGDTVNITAIVADFAGNGTTYTESTTETYIDVSPPVVSPNEFNVLSTDAISFTLSEELNIAEGAVTGFSVGGVGSITSVIYSDKGGTNLVTINGTGFIGGTTTVTHTPDGTLYDLAGNQLNGFTELTVVNIVNLGPGDIAFTGYNSDGDPDSFSFVLLKDIQASTKIKFTDNGWQGTADKLTTDESTISWVATSNMFAGTEITIGENATQDAMLTSHGSVSIDPIMSSRNWELQAAGDQILAYQGTSDNPTFLAGIHVSNDNTEDGTTYWNTVAASNGDNNRSALPTVTELGADKGLTNGVNAISFSQISSIKENVQYTGAKTAATPSALAIIINDNATNETASWDNQQDNTSFTLTSGFNYSLPPDLQSTSPTNGSTIKSNPVLTITYDDNVSAGTSTGTGDIKIYNVTDGNLLVTQFNIGDPELIIDGSATVSIDLSAIALEHAKTYKVDVAEWIFVNTDGNHNIAIDGATQWSFEVDIIPPTVSSITRGTASPLNANNGTSASSITYSVLFSEPVQSGTVELADFTPAGTAAGVGSAAAVTNITGSGDTYTVTVSSINLLGDLTINFTGAIDDIAGNTGTTGRVGDESFIIINPEPSQQPTTLVATPGADSYTLNVSWTEGEGDQAADGYLVYIKGPNGTFPSDPTDLIPVDNDLIIGLDEGVVNTATTSVPISDLYSGTTYDIKVFPYTNNGIHIDYKTNETVLTGSGQTSVAYETLVSFVSNNATVNSINNTQGSVTSESGNLEFSISDDGGNPAADNSPTLIPEITFKQGVGDEIINWTEVIEGAELSDGTNSMTASNIGNTSILFTGINMGAGQLGYIADNGTKEYKLKIWIKSNLSTSWKESID